MVTIHGVHEFDLDAGAPDTGGQNVFVNQMAAEMVPFGWDITIVNRGGYPHPRSGEMRRGTVTAGTPAPDRLRTCLLDDGTPQFIRKEAMSGQTDVLADRLVQLVQTMIDDGRPPELFISHYWDGGVVTARALERMWPRGAGKVSRASAPARPPHVWIPHSLGTVKRRNIAAEQWPALNLEARERSEALVLDAVDVVGTTSLTIESALRDDYRYTGQTVFLPPCIDSGRFFPGDGGVNEETARLLADHSSRTPEQISSMRIMTEISRTDRTKRKDILLDVVAALAPKYPDLFLAVTIDSRQEDVAGELHRTIETLGIGDHVAVLGNVAPAVPALLRSTCVYVTPSEMEGFGMSLQEAAACGVPAVASDLVPFAVEYLGGGEGGDHNEGGDQSNDAGHRPGAIVVPHGDVDRFVAAVAMLLADPVLRGRMGAAAREITVPAFTWNRLLTGFLGVVAKKT